MIELPAGATEDARKAAQAKAESLAKQAAADPAKFAELARANSQDAGSADKGGDLGWLAPGMLTGPPETAIFSLSKDQVRSAERRVGKECVTTVLYRWSPNHSKKNHKIHIQ